MPEHGTECELKPDKIGADKHVDRQFFQPLDRLDDLPIGIPWHGNHNIIDFSKPRRRDQIVDAAKHRIAAELPPMAAMLLVIDAEHLGEVGIYVIESLDKLPCLRTAAKDHHAATNQIAARQRSEEHTSELQSRRH